MGTGVSRLGDFTKKRAFKYGNELQKYGQFSAAKKYLLHAIGLSNGHDVKIYSLLAQGASSSGLSVELALYCYFMACQAIYKRIDSNDNSCMPIRCSSDDKDVFKYMGLLLKNKFDQLKSLFNEKDEDIINIKNNIEFNSDWHSNILFGYLKLKVFNTERLNYYNDILFLHYNSNEIVCRS